MRLSFTLFASAMLSAGVIAHAATTTQLTSSSQLSSTDTAFAVPGSVGTIFPGPSVSFSAAGLTFSRSAGQYEIDQIGFTYGGSAFANNTKVLGAGGFQGPGNGGPVTLSFSTPVTQFGLNIEDFNSGPYTVVFSAFDPSGTSLGSFLAAGNDPVGGGPSILSFEGLTVSGDTIAKVTFNDAAAGGSNNLIFGNVAYGSPAPAAVTPEPSSLALLGTGLMGIVSMVKRRTRP